MAINIDEAWKKISEGLQAYLELKSLSPKEYMEYHLLLYNYLNQPAAPLQMFGGDVYDRMKAFLENWAGLVYQNLEPLQGGPLLELYVKKWTDHEFSSRIFGACFAYLNRHAIIGRRAAGETNVYELYNLSLVIWKTEIFEKLAPKLLDATLSQIHLERAGQETEYLQIRKIVENVQNMGYAMEHKNEPQEKLKLYKDFLETRYLETTREFYDEEIKGFLANGGYCEDFMELVESRIKQEVTRVDCQLNTITMNPLNKLLNDIMITAHLDFLTAHIGRLLDAEAFEHLSRMYRLCGRLDDDKGVKALVQALQKHIKTEGHKAMEIVAKEAFSDPKIYVDTLEEAYEKYKGLVEKFFKKDPKFMKAVDTAALDFVNKNAVVLMVAEDKGRSIKSAELIARYCDGLMRKNSKMPSEMEMEDLQKRVISIFQFLEDKDAYMKFYTKYFCKRLNNELSASDEAETVFIAKLTETCGFEFTSRLTKMSQDCQISKDLTSEFKETQGKTSMEFNIQVLSTGSWPSFQQTQLALPSIFSTVREDFTKFYNSKYNGRKLNWVFQQSKGELTSTAFKGKKYVFGATTAQMCTLLLFNDQLQYPVEDIMSHTGMDSKITQLVVGSLVKHKLLTSDKELTNEEVPMDATVTLNSTYSNKKVRVDLAKMSMEAQQARDREKVQKELRDGRGNEISAAVVRIMKARKQMSMKDLINELIAQLSSRFSADARTLKKGIFNMVEKAFIKRSDGQKDMFEYLA